LTGAAKANEKLCAGFTIKMPSNMVVGGDSRDETKDSNGQKDDPENNCGCLNHF
jgi:hypothetical protein